MLKLCGFHLSNYHNKVRLALLEKGVPFEEDANCTPSQKDEWLARSPIGKVPILELDGGRRIAESDVICEYLEEAYPQKPLLPKDPYERAKVRELVTFIDWHLEMAARQLYGAAFFGAPPLSESNAARIRREVEQKIAGFRKLAKFSPYVAGDTFTMADCAAFADLPVVGMATKAIYGEDLLLAAGVDYKPYLQLVGERASARKVVADRKAAQAK
jgi:glutathione S-transferase